MKKKWIAIGMTLIMTAAMALPAMAAVDYETARLRSDFNIVIDGKEKNFKRADGSAAFALVYEDSTYLPLRAIGEAIGKNVNWDENTKTITLEVFYRTKRSPLARSVDWSLSIFLRVFGEDGSEIGNGGGGYKSGGYYGVGTDYKREIPADAKTLGIYCSDLIVMVDLETGEVTEDAKT